MKFLTFLLFCIVAFRVECQESFLQSDYEVILTSVLNQTLELGVPAECLSALSDSRVNILSCEC